LEKLVTFRFVHQQIIKNKLYIILLVSSFNQFLSVVISVLSIEVLWSTKIVSTNVSLVVSDFLLTVDEDNDSDYHGQENAPDKDPDPSVTTFLFRFNWFDRFNWFVRVDWIDRVDWINRLDWMEWFNNILLFIGKEFHLTGLFVQNQNLILLDLIVLSIDIDILNETGFLSISGFELSKVLTSVEIVVLLDTVERWVLDLIIFLY
jgi:hypothetical protein